MGRFADGLKAFQVKAERVTSEVFVNSVSSAKDSITDGSTLTGAPGQPVDTGTLKASWQMVMESPTSAIIGTNLVYAPSIEDGVSYAHGGKPLVKRSEVGGWHSVALTIAGFQRLVAEEVRKAGGDVGGAS